MSCSLKINEVALQTVLRFDVKFALKSRACSTKTELSNADIITSVVGQNVKKAETNTTAIFITNTKNC